MKDPLSVDVGDTVKLLSSPIQRIVIPMDTIHNICQIIEEELVNLQQSGIFSLGIYKSNSSIHPTYTSSTAYFFQNNQQVNLGDITPGTEITVVTNSGSSVVIKDVHTYPSILAVGMDVICDVMLSHLYKLRPWLAKALKHTPIYTTRISDETASIIEDNIFYSNQTIIEHLDKHPSRIVNVKVTPVGIIVGICCDIRVYLWTKHQEEALNGLWVDDFL